MSNVMTLEEMKNKFKYEFKFWLQIFKSDPVSCLKSEDRSASYEMSACHVFKLNNGQYAVVVEEGCSCYEPINANIDLYPTERIALDKFNEWEKKRR